MINYCTTVQVALRNIISSQPNRLIYTNHIYFVCLPIVCMVPVLMHWLRITRHARHIQQHRTCRLIIFVSQLLAHSGKANYAGLSKGTNCGAAFLDTTFMWEHITHGPDGVLEMPLYIIQRLNDYGTSDSDSNSKSTRADSDSDSRVFQSPWFQFQSCKYYDSDSNSDSSDFESKFQWQWLWLQVRV